MDVQKYEMKNGLVVATEAMPHLRSVSIGVWIKGGSRFEAPDASGISHFIEHLLFKGTMTRSAVEIAEAIDSVGGQLNAFTDKEYVGFYAKVLDRHLPLAFELLSDIVLNPTFPAHEMRRERNVIFEEINMVEDSPQELIQDLFMENFWKAHPLGRAVSGTKESVAAITRAQVTRYFRKNYNAINTIVSVPETSPRRGVRMARRYFSDLPPGVPANPGPAALGRGRRACCAASPISSRRTSALGRPPLSIVSQDRYAAHVLCGVLGGGMSSRLFQKIREKRGLVYSIYSSLNLYRDAGTLLVYAGMAPGAAHAVVDLTIEGDARPAPEARLARRAETRQGEHKGGRRAEPRELEQPDDPPGPASSCTSGNSTPCRRSSTVSKPSVRRMFAGWPTKCSTRRT